MRVLDAIAAALTIREEVPAPTMPAGLRPPALGQASIVTPRAALALTSVYRAIDVILTGVEQLSVDVWKNGRQLDPNQTPTFLTAPDEDTDLADLIGETTAALALNGNAYWRLIRNRDGAVVGIRILDPAQCVPTLDPASGRRRVQWDGREWTARDILHLRKLRVPGEAYGLGPIEAAARDIAGARNLAKWGADFVTGGGVPTGVLSTDQALTPEQASDGAKAWNERNSTSGGIAVLGRGLKYVHTAIKPADMQFLESRNFDDRQMARIFGIPSHLMLVGVEGSSLTYQNLASADLAFMRWTLMSYLRRIESALTKAAPRGQTVRFNLDALLRADKSTRMATHATAIEAGIYSPDYAREIEGINSSAAPKETPTK